MPVYQPQRRGVRLSEAYAEAAAIAPIQRAMLHCFELWHPSMDEPARVVNNFEPLMATLEADAPRDAGETVEFLAAIVNGTRPEESDGAATPSITVTLDNIAGMFSEALAKARGSLEPWELIERVFASDDLSGPALLPVMKMTFTDSTLEGGRASLKASYGDPVNVDIPRLTFKPEEYTTLSAR